MSEEKKYNIAVAGATGAVGGAMLEVLARRNFPIAELRLLASERSVGKKLRFRGKDIEVQLLSHDAFKDIDVALFSAGAARSLEFAPSAAAAGQLWLTTQVPFAWMTISPWWSRR